MISEDTDKIAYLGNNVVMLAGSLSAARELLGRCEAAITKYQSGSDELALTNLLTALREAVKQRKWERINEYLSAKYGVDYDYFLLRSKDHFSEAHYLQVWAEIRAVDLDAELVISSFSDDEAVLIKIAIDGRVTWEDHYSTAGNGSAVAHAFLCQREYSDDMQLHECLARVIEAKIAAERTPYVGQATVVEISSPGKIIDVDAKCLSRIIGRIHKRMLTLPIGPIDERFLAERPNGTNEGEA